jgi:hypothetical protein
MLYTIVRTLKFYENSLVTNYALTRNIFTFSMISQGVRNVILIPHRSSYVLFVTAIILSNWMFCRGFPVHNIYIFRCNIQYNVAPFMRACFSPFIEYRAKKFAEPNYHSPRVIHVLMLKCMDEFAFYMHKVLCVCVCVGGGEGVKWNVGNWMHSIYFMCKELLF